MGEGWIVCTKFLWDNYYIKDEGVKHDDIESNTSKCN